jgi:hypothetical protein
VYLTEANKDRQLNTQREQDNKANNGLQKYTTEKLKKLASRTSCKLILILDTVTETWPGTVNSSKTVMFRFIIFSSVVILTSK